MSYIPTAEAVMVDSDPFGTKFNVYTAVSTEEKPSSETKGVEWEIHGHDMQVLHLDNLPPGTEFYTEIGSTMYLSPGIETDVECGLCGDAAQRVLSGESCIKVKLTNDSNENGYMGITPNFPAQIIPVNFSSSSSSSNNGLAMTTLIAKPGAIMSHIGDTSISCSPDFNLLRCCCAGLGCCRQKIEGGESGDESTAFLAAGGTILTRVLKEDESITVDKNSILAFADTVTLDVTLGGGACFCLCGGEGLFLPTLTGPGLIVLESMSFAKTKLAFTPPSSSSMNRSSDNGDDDGDDDGEIGRAHV